MMKNPFLYTAAMMLLGALSVGPCGIARSSFAEADDDVRRSRREEIERHLDQLRERMEILLDQGRTEEAERLEHEAREVARQLERRAREHARSRGEPDREQVIRHIREAIEHLHAAGVTSVAETLERRLRAMVEHGEHHPREHADHEHADHEHADHEHADHEHAHHEHAEHEHAEHEHHHRSDPQHAFREIHEQLDQLRREMNEMRRVLREVSRRR